MAAERSQRLTRQAKAQLAQPGPRQSSRPALAASWPFIAFSSRAASSAQNIQIRALLLANHPAANATQIGGYLRACDVGLRARTVASLSFVPLVLGGEVRRISARSAARAWRLRKAGEEVIITGSVSDQEAWQRYPEGREGAAAVGSDRPAAHVTPGAGMGPPRMPWPAARRWLRSCVLKGPG